MKNIEERLEDIAAGLSVPVEKLKIAYDNIKANEIVNSDDIRYLQDLGIPVMKEISELKKISLQQTSSMAKKGEIVFGDIVAIIGNLTSENGLFHNLKEKQSKTLVNFLRT